MALTTTAKILMLLLLSFWANIKPRRRPVFVLLLADRPNRPDRLIEQSEVMELSARAAAKNVHLSTIENRTSIGMIVVVPTSSAECPHRASLSSLISSPKDDHPLNPHVRPSTISSSLVLCPNWQTGHAAGSPAETSNGRTDQQTTGKRLGVARLDALDLFATFGFLAQNWTRGTRNSELGQGPLGFFGGAQKVRL